MSEKFFVHSPNDGALLVKGLDPDDLPEYLQNAPVFKVTQGTNGDFLVIPLDNVHQYLLAYMCRGCGTSKYHLPAGWKRVTNMCGNLECALGMTGQNACPQVHASSSKWSAGFKAMRGTVAPSGLIERLLQDGFREFNAAVMGRSFYEDTPVAQWAAHIVEALKNGQGNAWAHGLFAMKESLVFDHDKLDELEKCVLSAMDKSQSGESAEDWGEEW